MIDLKPIDIFYSERFHYPLPEGHRFPIDKYVLVKEQLLYQGIITEDQLIDPGLIDEAAILLVHTAEYWQQVKTLTLPPPMVRRIGLPNTEVSVNRARNSVAGTLRAAEAALLNGVGMNLAGGTHHAYLDRGEGFSTLNDIAIAASFLLSQQQVNNILIIDLDVHQGNGNAFIFAGHPSVFTFSMHAQDNYPLKKEKSDLDIALPSGTSDDEYLDVLQHTLPHLFETHQPDLVFFQAGIDVLATDKLGKLALTKQGCLQRDRMVFQTCKKYGAPVASCMGGGYSPRMADIVDAHCNTFRAADEAFA
ncbi:histone deacetylase family protein [Catalinimonas niigatensis]|uniref:histone deacetylase family protein n=1 Tax=Catalinimonas niigatensis TaxID=1397264 RepID=UPI0026658F11|nr:histone deacetylase [Catalinimonas niigatensis]WPP49934.1 histone deacetylase [Catalinimonas niigatensis]